VEVVVDMDMDVSMIMMWKWERKSGDMVLGVEMMRI
jgi:hypothetical protein